LQSILRNADTKVQEKQGRARSNAWRMGLPGPLNATTRICVHVARIGENSRRIRFLYGTGPYDRAHGDGRKRERMVTTARSPHFHANDEPAQKQSCLTTSPF
jgi:hypothetical protein